MNILYDATDILLGKINNFYRTGIYFCSYNILKFLKNFPNINICLYTYDEHIYSILNIKKQEILKGLKIIKLRDTSDYRNKINLHLDRISKTNNVILKLVCFIKIIKNILHIIFINENRANTELKKIDAVFSPCYAFPPKIYRTNIKRFKLLHDVTPLLFPDYFPGGDSSLWIDNMANSLDHDTWYFCNSESTKKDFLKYFKNNMDEGKMLVTYISSANSFKPIYDKKTINYIENKYKINIGPNKYIFSFCTLEHRKNLLFTVKCFVKFIQKNNINDLYFLLGGNQWDNFINHFNTTLGELPDNYRSKIVRLGYVEDSDVNMLYSNSLFFTYLSQYEGFGMPPLEAMQAGTPVITANNSSIPEVVGNAAITIDYNDEQACIKAMETFYFDDDLRQEYIRKGFERAKLFSWDNTVNSMIHKIKETIPVQ